jgi:hypothetical protein
MFNNCGANVSSAMKNEVATVNAMKNGFVSAFQIPL